MKLSKKIGKYRSRFKPHLFMCPFSGLWSVENVHRHRLLPTFEEAVAEARSWVY